MHVLINSYVGLNAYPSSARQRQQWNFTRCRYHPGYHPEGLPASRVDRVSDIHKRNYVEV